MKRLAPATALLAIWILVPSSTLPGTEIRPRDDGKEDDKEQQEKKLVPVMDRGEGDLAGRIRKVAEEGQTNLKEIQKLLDEIQQSLAAKETGTPTQEKQTRVVEKMSRLLEELEKQCSKCSSSSSESQQKQQGQNPQKQQKKDEKPSPQDQKPREQQKSQAKLQESEKERKDGKAENDRTQDAKPPDSRAGTLREQLLDVSRRWGILPPKLRDEVLFSTGKEAPREYLEIISRYYKRMTEFYEENSGKK